jgi:cation diffusion facilitator family transporter
LSSDVRKKRAALVSVVSNSGLVGLKLFVGLAIGSVSILSEAIHSGVDLLASCIAYIAVRTSGQPADEKHPFGHGKIENISGTVEALLIFGAVGWIVYESVDSLLHPEPLLAVGWGAGVMLFSALTNIAVSGYLFRVAKETDSMALEADAWHLRTDVYTSIGVMAGLACIWAGMRILPELDLHWIDPLAALVVALLIGRAAFSLTVRSGRDLMDARLPQDEEVEIRSIVEARAAQARGYHGLRTRKAGSHRFVELHLVVDRSMTVEDSHRVSEDIASAIKARYPETSVTIHIDPCDCSCMEECLDGCLLTREERKEVCPDGGG